MCKYQRVFISIKPDMCPHTVDACRKANNPCGSKAQALTLESKGCSRHGRKDPDKATRRGRRLLSLPLTLLSGLRVCTSFRLSFDCVYACVQTGRDSRLPSTDWTILRQAGRARSKAERLAEESQARERVDQQQMSEGAVWKPSTRVSERARERESERERERESQQGGVFVWLCVRCSVGGVC